jgi:D-3-phosphoglycerate dehydrogenase
MMTTPSNARLQVPDILVAVDLTRCIEALEPLRRVGRVEYLANPRQEQVEAMIGEFDAYMGHTDVRLTEQLLTRAPRLRVACTCSTGTDHIDKDELSRRNIDLIALTTEYGLLDTFTSTAEMAWLLLLACRRRLPSLFERAKAGRIGLDPNYPLPPQLSCKTMGVIGYGRLGKMLVEYGKAVRMRILVCDPHKTINAPGVEQVNFDTLITTADVVTLHVHLNDETHHMMSRDVFAKMKYGVTFINVSRGDLIDEDALLDALRSGRVAAAGLDVVHNEWDPDLATRPLLQYAKTHDNLILTPHVAGGSLESVIDARIFIANQLADYIVRTGMTRVAIE